LTKSLNILSDSGVDFTIGKLTIGPVSDFALVGARVSFLDVNGVTGRSLIEGCTFKSGPATIRNCEELLVQRSTFLGQSACYPDGPLLVATGAAEVRNARVVFTDCYFEGGDLADEFPLNPLLQCEVHYPVAGNPLVISDQSEVVLAGCTLQGYGLVGFTGFTPPAVLVSDSRVTIRGNQSHELRSNLPEVIQMDALSTLKVSGVELIFDGVSVGRAGMPPGGMTPSIPEPFLVLGGGLLPGDTLTAAHYAPLGAAIFSAISFGPGSISYPLGSEALWLDLNQVWQVQSLIGLGHEVEQTFSASLPTTPTLAGLQVGFQSIVFHGSNAWLTNPVTLILGA
jgi:hypothetical protein